MQNLLTLLQNSLSDLRFCDVFRGYKKGKLVENGLKSKISRPVVFFKEDVVKNFVKFRFSKEDTFLKQAGSKFQDLMTSICYRLMPKFHSFFTSRVNK